MAQITVTINGNEQILDENSTIQDLLDIRNVTGKMFVVEKNMEIVPKDKYDLKTQNGDVYEVVGFFGGG